VAKLKELDDAGFLFDKLQGYSQGYGQGRKQIRISTQAELQANPKQNDYIEAINAYTLSEKYRSKNYPHIPPTKQIFAYYPMVKEVLDNIAGEVPAAIAADNPDDPAAAAPLMPALAAAEQPPVGDRPPLVPAVIAAEQPLAPTVRSNGAGSAISPNSHAMASSTEPWVGRVSAAIEVQTCTTKHLHDLGAIVGKPRIAPQWFLDKLLSTTSQASTFNLLGITKVYLTPQIYYDSKFSYAVKKYEVCKVQLCQLLQALNARQVEYTAESHETTHEQTTTTTRRTTFTSSSSEQTQKEVVETITKTRRLDVKRMVQVGVRVSGP
jgi:hypothetical protein